MVLPVLVSCFGFIIFELVHIIDCNLPIGVIDTSLWYV